MHGRAKTDNFQLFKVGISRPEHYIFRVYISMDNFANMAVTHGHQYFFDAFSRQTFPKATLLRQFSK